MVLPLQLAIYWDAPGYKVRTNDTEELFYDKKTAFPATFFEGSVRQQKLIRRYLSFGKIGDIYYSLGEVVFINITPCC
jgi:hypothetical protein